MPEKAPNSFSSSAPAAEASGKVRPAAAGRLHGLNRNAEERHAAFASGVVALMGRSAGKARRPARAMPKPSAAIFPSRDSPRRRAGHQSHPEAGGKSRRRAGFCPRSGTRCPAGLARRSHTLCLRQRRSAARSAMSRAPKCQSLVRSCATNAGKGATSVAFGADVCGVHARP